MHGRQMMSLLCYSDVIMSCRISAYSGISRSLFFFKQKMRYLMVSKKKNCDPRDGFFYPTLKLMIDSYRI